MGVLIETVHRVQEELNNCLDTFDMLIDQGDSYAIYIDQDRLEEAEDRLRAIVKKLRQLKNRPLTADM